MLCAQHNNPSKYTGLIPHILATPYSRDYCRPPEAQTNKCFHQRRSTAGYFCKQVSDLCSKIAILSLKMGPILIGLQLLCNWLHSQPDTRAHPRVSRVRSTKSNTTLRSKLSSRVYARSASIESVHDGERARERINRSEATSNEYLYEAQRSGVTLKHEPSVAERGCGRALRRADTFWPRFTLHSKIPQKPKPPNFLSPN